MDKVSSVIKYTGPNRDHPKFPDWVKGDSIRMSSLWNSMLPEVSKSCMFLPTARGIWETVKHLFKEIGYSNALQIKDHNLS